MIKKLLENEDFLLLLLIIGAIFIIVMQAWVFGGVSDPIGKLP